VPSVFLRHGLFVTAANCIPPAGLWDLENYLTERRKEIDRDYDYRNSTDLSANAWFRQVALEYLRWRTPFAQLGPAGGGSFLFFYCLAFLLEIES